MRVPLQVLRSFTVLVTYSVWFQERGTLQESKSSPESMYIVDVVVTKSRTPEPRSHGSGKTFPR